MPRDGSGTYTKPGGSTAVTGTTISSTAYNALINDLEADANVARPVSAGGTGAASASAARTALDVPGKAASDTISGDWAFTGSPDFSGVGNAGAILAALGLTGAVMSFAMSTAPTGWLECDGSAVSRTTYADLFTAIGTTYGTGDGSTTFNLPDLRGEFVRGWDNSRGVDSGRAIGTTQDEQTNNLRDFFTSSTGSPAGATGTDPIPQDGSYSDYGITGRGASDVYWNFRMRHHGHESRPRNVALMYCIKT